MSLSGNFVMYLFVRNSLVVNINKLINRTFFYGDIGVVYQLLMIYFCLKI